MQTQVGFHRLGRLIVVAFVALFSSCSRPPDLTWEGVAIPGSDKVKGGITLYDVRFIGGAFYAVGDTGIFSSTDGKNWRMRYQGDCSFNGIAHGGGRTVVVGGCDKKGGVIVISADGEIWEEAAVKDQWMLNAVAYGAGRFVAVGYNTTVLVSSDGLSWTSRKDGLPDLGQLYDIAFGQGLFIATGKTGNILTSTDGLWWKQKTLDTRRELHGIAYGDGRFVIVTNDFWFSDVRAFVSTDGNTWEAEDTDCNENLYAVTYGGGVYMAVGGNHYQGGRGNIDITQTWDKRCALFSSLNGSSWRKNSCVAGHQLFGAAYGSGRFVAVGRDVILLSSPLD